MLWIDSGAQSIPDAPAEIEFAGVSVQLTAPARQRLQQSLNGLYIDRVLLLNQVETLNQLRPTLDVSLTETGIPLDYRYACPPIADAAYDPYAYWGISNQLANQLALPIDQSVDSRRHVTLATKAVLPYIGRLHSQHKHWIKTLFDYLDSQGSPLQLESDSTHWLLDLQAPPAIWSILARKIAFEHEQALLQLTPAFIILEYTDGAGKTLAEIASRLKVDPDRLSPYNSWLLSARIPASVDFPVLLRLTPEEYLAVKPRIVPKSFRANTASPLTGTDLGFPILRRLANATAHPSSLLYQINDRRGIQAQLCDNAITLAYYGKVPVSTFFKINDLSEQDLIKPGDIYYLQSKAKRAKIPFHVVQQGQTLREVSNMYGVRIKSLLRYNRMKPTQRVQPGRIVWMQRKRPARYPVEYQSAPPVDNKLPDQPTLLTGDVPTLSDSSKQTQTTTTTARLPQPSSPSLPEADTRSQLGREQVSPSQPGTPVINKIHVVKPGQTYFSVARLYGVSVNQLYTWNNLTAKQPLQIGQELLIGTLGPVISTASSRQPVQAAKKPKKADNLLTAPVKQAYYYRVKPGETVYRIAKNYSVSVADLMRWNGLKNFTIEVGQRLVILQQTK